MSKTIDTSSRAHVAQEFKESCTTESPEGEAAAACSPVHLGSQAESIAAVCSEGGPACDEEISLFYWIFNEHLQLAIETLIWQRRGALTAMVFGTNVERI